MVKHQEPIKNFLKVLYRLNSKNMVDNIVIDNDLAKVVDLLHQIREVNKMILLHKRKGGSISMRRQYEDLKDRFLNDLKEALSGFDVEVSLKKKAA